MAEIRDRGSVLATEEGRTRLKDAQSSKHNYDGKAWTYTEIAIKAGVDAKTVSRFLNRKQPVDESKARAICQALGVDFSQIVEIRSSKVTSKEQGHETKWQQICRAMLDRQKKLSTNEIIASEAMQFDLLNDEIFVSLALVERKEPDRLNQNVHPVHSVERYEEKPAIEYEVFQEQVLKKGKDDRIAIIGEPGAGKTTLLQHIAFWILDQGLGLPIWISLGDLVKSGELQRLKDYLTQVWLEDAISDVTQDVKADFLEQLNKQRVWLLLDGADEIVASSDVTLREIDKQLGSWLSQSCILLTCRLNVWDADINALRDFQTYRTKEFHYPTQVEQFIENGFCRSNPSSGQRLKTELAKPERDRLRQLVKNPLRLMMLCTTWQEQTGLPSTKAELYERFVSEFHKWNKTKWKKKDLNYALLPNTEAKQEKLNQALGRLACRALDKESSPFRLPHNLVVEELGDPDEDGSNFWLALNLGWLQLARNSDKLSEKVYSFFHLTFQEYFAALAIDDWDDFLPRNHVDRPTKNRKGECKYRIFEPQWKEVILFWLGRSDVEKNEKEAFIDRLIHFDDGYGDLYLYKCRAYFLAAAGITEFTCSRADKIIAQIMQWAFGYFDVETNKLRTFFQPIRGDIPALSETDQDIPKQKGAIFALSETDQGMAVKALISCIEERLNSPSSLEPLKVLGRVGVGHPVAIRFLEQLIQTTEDEYIRQEAIQILKEIDPKHPYFDSLEVQSVLQEMNLIDYFQSLEKKTTRKLIIFISQNHSIELLKHGLTIHWLQSKGLGKMNCEVLTISINELKRYVSIEIFKADLNLFVTCYELLWDCIQIMSFPDFFNAWHSPSSVSAELPVDHGEIKS